MEKRGSRHPFGCRLFLLFVCNVTPFDIIEIIHNTSVKMLSVILVNIWGTVQTFFTNFDGNLEIMYLYRYNIFV